MKYEEKYNKIVNECNKILIKKNQFILLLITFLIIKDLIQISLISLILYFAMIFYYY